MLNFTELEENGIEFVGVYDGPHRIGNIIWEIGPDANLPRFIPMELFGRSGQRFITINQMREIIDYWDEVAASKGQIFMPTPINCPYCGDEPGKHKLNCCIIKGHV